MFFSSPCLAPSLIAHCPGCSRSGCNLQFTVISSPGSTSLEVMSFRIYVLSLTDPSRVLWQLGLSEWLCQRPKSGIVHIPFFLMCDVPRSVPFGILSPAKIPFPCISDALRRKSTFAPGTLSGQHASFMYLLQFSNSNFMYIIIYQI